MKAANLTAFLKFGKAKKSKNCVIFAKKSWVATKLETGGAKLGVGVVPLGTGLKPPLCFRIKE